MQEPCQSCLIGQDLDSRQGGAVHVGSSLRKFPYQPSEVSESPDCAAPAADLPSTYGDVCCVCALRGAFAAGTIRSVLRGELKWNTTRTV